MMKIFLVILNFICTKLLLGIQISNVEYTVDKIQYNDGAL